MSTRSLKKLQSISAGGGAGLVSVDHVARSSVTSARSSPALAGRTSIEGKVRLEPLQAAFAAEAGLLLAAQPARRGEAGVRVCPDGAGPQPPRPPEGGRAPL